MDKIESNEKYCLYMHKSKINNKVYIGITKKVNPKHKWRNGKGYNDTNRFANYIKKYGWDSLEHIIVYENLSKKEAEEKEIELIKFYNATDERYGFNLSYGGNAPGMFTEATLQKLRDVYKNIEKKNIYQYDVNGNFIKIWSSAKDASEELKLCRGSIYDCCNKKLKTLGGYVWSYEILNNYKKPEEKQAKVVYQYDLNGIYVKSYKSMGATARELNISVGNIQQCCRGHINTTHDLVFLCDYYDKLPENIMKERNLEYKRLIKNKKVKNIFPKKIYQYSIDGMFIKEWESSKNLCEEYKMNQAAISNCCLGRTKVAYGFIWLYNYYSELPYDILKYRQSLCTKKIKNITTGEIFNSIVEAVYIYGSRTGIINACKGKYKTSGGCRWQYI